MGQTIYFQDVVSSTQKVAHELANNGAPEGTIVVADKQTEGRGECRERGTLLKETESG